MATDEEVRAALEQVERLHTAITEEAECWADGDEDMQRVHEARFPDCNPRTCDGHTYSMQVCTECGYTHNGDYVTYRPHPCATLRAVSSLTLEKSVCPGCGHELHTGFCGCGCLDDRIVR